MFKTEDKYAIARILNHPDVSEWVRDDLSPDRYLPVMHKSIIYLMNDEKTCVARVDPMNGVCCQGHIAAMPEVWGRSAEFTRLAIEWVFAFTRYMKIITMVPEYNVRAIRLCEKVGMSREGVITQSFLKDWKLHDQVVFGLNKKYMGVE